jgi:hypothetical protein
MITSGGAVSESARLIMIKMQRGVFGALADSSVFIAALA